MKIKSYELLDHEQLPIFFLYMLDQIQVLLNNLLVQVYIDTKREDAYF